MASDWNDPDPAEDAWKRSMLDARQQARDALAECSGPHIDPRQAVNCPGVVQFLHAKTLDYYRHIAPKSDGLPDELWNAELTTVSVPATQRVEGGMTNWYGDYDIEGVLENARWTEKPVQLASLREKWQENATAAIEIVIDHRATEEQTREYEQYDLYLPPIACESVIAQLDKCLDNLKWLPEAGEIDINADDVEVLR